MYDHGSTFAADTTVSLAKREKMRYTVIVYITDGVSVALSLNFLPLPKK